MAKLATEAWRRHANPWSVWTRFAAIPLAVGAGWSRVWIGDWFWLLLGLVAVWLVANTLVFKPVDRPVHWASRAVYGEHLWLSGAGTPGGRTLSRVLIAAGLLGMAVCVLGVVRLSPPAAVLGMAVLVGSQLWRLELFRRLYDRHSA